MVLVEQHDPILIAVACHDLLDLLAHLQREGHLIGKLDQSEASFLGLVAFRQFGQDRQRSDRRERINDRFIGLPLARGAVREILEIAEAVGQPGQIVRLRRLAGSELGRVLGEQAAQPEDGIRHCVELLAERHEPLVASLDHDAPGEQPR